MCAAVCPVIVSRAEWGAQPPKSAIALKVPVDHVIIHHTDGATSDSKEGCSKVIRQIQKYHVETKKWDDIGYNFVVGGDGRIYEGRGWKTLGSQAKGYNSKSIGISFMGNYNKSEPSAAMLTAAKNLIEYGVLMKYISSSYELHGHRNVKCTDCPGASLYSIIEKWPRFKGGKLPGYNIYIYIPFHLGVFQLGLNFPILLSRHFIKK
ncbi:peptidoglycan-recognition protein SC2 [Caerostris darwini]|uniref:Peptidoglycan-recognition protein n=1 Tax=Caerostris darwini TaxID=1538125 RepID=A0AAV4VPY8_9ARAC|nr:peptidoglycan-recognition protein SC2 [Caerostris darwini]